MTMVDVSRACVWVLVAGLGWGLGVGCGDDGTYQAPGYIATTSSNAGTSDGTGGTSTATPTGSGELVLGVRALRMEALEVGEEVVRAFGVRNASGQEALTLEGLEVSAAAGLTASCDGGFPQTLAPGEEAACEARYVPETRERVEGVVQVRSSAADPSSGVLVVEGVVLEPRVWVEPGELRFEAPLGSQQSASVVVRNLGPGVLAVREVGIDGGAGFAVGYDRAVYGGFGPLAPLRLAPFDPSIRPGDAGYAANALELEVTFAPEREGPSQGALVIETDAPDAPVETVMLEGLGQGDGCLELVDGAQVSFGAVDLGRVVWREVAVRNCGLSPLTLGALVPGDGAAVWNFADAAAVFFVRGLDAIELDEDGGLLEPLRLEPGATAPFEVGYSPIDDAFDLSDVQLVAAGPDGPQARLELIGRGNAEPNFCPIAIAGARPADAPDSEAQTALVVPMGAGVVLDGRDSGDPDGAVEGYVWELVARPDGSTAELEPVEGAEEDGAQRYLAPDAGGAYEIELNVLDERGLRSCTPARVRVESFEPAELDFQLVWDNPDDPDQADLSGSDLDLHVLKMPEGIWFQAPYDVHFGNRQPSWDPENPVMDIDDTNGAGPENISLDDPADCQWYAVAIHQWRAQFGTAFATLRIFNAGVLIYEFADKPMESTNDWWDVVRIHWPSGEVVVVDELRNGRPGQTEGAPVTDAMVEAGLCGTPEPDAGGGEGGEGGGEGGE